MQVYTSTSLCYTQHWQVTRCLVVVGVDARRVDMRSVEGTIQRLIGSGLDPQLENNPYLCFVYTSFQVGPDISICPAAALCLL